VYVAGADPYRKDLLGGLALGIEDMASRDRMVMEACATRAVPFTVTLAGGYAADTADTVAIQSETVARAIAVGESE
jgi:acetoin utilization deacetylase AcuC-like enzyme